MEIFSDGKYPYESGLYLVSGGDFGYSGTTSPISTQKAEEISQEYLEINYGVHAWLKQRNDFLIDSDAGPTPEVDPLTPEQYKAKAEALRGKIERLGLGRRFTLTPEQEVMHDCLEAAEIYLFEKYIRDDGERMPLTEYYKKVIGDELKPMAKSDLEEPKREFLRLLSANGYSFRQRDDDSIQEAYAQYQREHGFSQRDFIEARFRNYNRSLSYPMRRVLRDPASNGQDEEFDFKLEWRYDDAQWFCWERIENGEKRVDLNSAHAEEWNWGEAERYPLHEVRGHLQKFAHQFKEIEKGNLDKSMKISLIPSPVCWLDEAIAQTLDTYAGIDISQEGELSVAKYRMYMRAKSQAGYRMGVDEVSLDQAVLETMTYAPHKNREQVQSELTQMRDHPLWRIYAILYGRGDLELMDLAGRLTPSARVKVLRHIYEKPMTQQQFWRFLPRFLQD